MVSDLFAPSYSCNCPATPEMMIVSAQSSIKSFWLCPVQGLAREESKVSLRNIVHFSVLSLILSFSLIAFYSLLYSLILSGSPRGI